MRYTVFSCIILGVLQISDHAPVGEFQGEAPQHSKWLRFNTHPLNDPYCVASFKTECQEKQEELESEYEMKYKQNPTESN